MDVPESSPQEERREEDSPRAGGGHRMVVHDLADRRDRLGRPRSWHRGPTSPTPGGRPRPRPARRPAASPLRQRRVRAATADRANRESSIDRQVMPGGRPGRPLSVGVARQHPDAGQACAKSDRHAPRRPVHRSIVPLCGLESLAGSARQQSVNEQHLVPRRLTSTISSILYAIVASHPQRRTVSNSGEPVWLITRRAGSRRAAGGASGHRWHRTAARRPVALDGAKLPVNDPGLLGWRA